MIYIEEIKLHLNDVRLAFNNLPQEEKVSEIWSDWYADSMVKGGLETDQEELAALLREADLSYHAEAEQFPWIDYVGKFLFLHLQK